MAATESQKQLLCLIRDFANEKSERDSRIINLKKRTEELRSELNAANEELENRKRLKETAEQELRGYEVELLMSEASIQALETRIASIQDEISKIGSDIDNIKNKEAALREDFIHYMVEVKTKIRKLQELAVLNLKQRNSSGTSAGDEGGRFVGLEKEYSVVIAQTATEEQECEREQNLNHQLQQELTDLKRRLELVEAIMKANNELLDLTRQTSAMEDECASFSEVLQRKCICPSCHFDNSETLAKLLEKEHQ